MSLAAGTRFGPYEILGSLGAGGMGEVYRARDTRLQREVAVKVLPADFAADPDRRARFEREAQAIAALSHPNVLAIHDVGTHPSTSAGPPQMYVVTELLHGETLRERLASGARGRTPAEGVSTGAPTHTAALPMRKAIDIAVQLARGLAAAHDKGLVHRDLKPENIFLVDDGQVKILDFGLARHAPSASGASETVAALTDPGMVVGTVGYMAPEQVRGLTTDARADLFALGAVLYEMLSGRRAFRGDTAADTMFAIVKEDPPELAPIRADIPPALDRIVRHCLEKNPAERFQTARDVAFALEALSGSGAVSSPGVIHAESPPRRHLGRRAWLTTAMVAIAAAAGMLLERALESGAPASPTPSLTPLTFGRGTIRTARFSPDGTTVVYGAAWDGAPLRVFQTRLGSPESVPLQLPDADVLAVSPTGELAVSLGRRFFQWVSEGTLATAPLVGGSPRPVVEGVSNADWSSDGSKLAIVRRVNGKDRLEFPIDRVLYETTGYISHPRVSPSDDAVAFLDHPIYGDNRGFVAVVTTEERKTTFPQEWGWVEGLAWSPDGREIWFTASDNGRNSIHGVTLRGTLRVIWRVPIDLTILDVARDGRVLLAANALRIVSYWLGPGETRERDLSRDLFSTVSNPRDLAPDGRTILFTNAAEGAYGVGLGRVDAAPVRLGPGAGLQLSPDGRWALTLAVSQPTGLALLPTGAGQSRSLTTEGFMYMSGAWIDDARLVVVASRGDGPGQAFVQPVAGGPPQAIDAATGLELIASERIRPLVSPDGTRFIARTSDQRTAIVSLSGQQPRVLAGVLPSDHAIGWTADSAAVYLARESASHATATIAKLDLATGRIERQREVSVPDPAGVSTPVARTMLITPDGRTVVYTVNRILSELYLVEGIR